MASITIWNRVEPRPRADDISVGLRAEVRDPLWMLTRQWQMGELKGEDAGSPAYTRVVVKTASLTHWAVADGPGQALDGTRPLEAAVLSEPHAPDVATQVELTQTFFELLEREVSAAVAATLEGRFITFAPLVIPPEDELNPRDRSAGDLIDLVTGRAADGIRILALTSTTPPTVPAEITTDPAQIAAVRTALTNFAGWVRVTFGAVGREDPAAWQPRRLEYRLSVGVETPAANTAVLNVVPGPGGELDWSSFDFVGEPGGLFNGMEEPDPVLMVPSRVRYPGLPWARFWRFEDGQLSLPDVQLDPPELLKLLVLDFALKAGVDWFDVAIPQMPGSVAQVSSLLVKDVFGFYTVIDRADPPSSPAGLQRWTMYSTFATLGGLAEFTILPPSAGRMIMLSPPVEQVRFARDENANIAWGIESILESPIGEPRSGTERDKAVQARLPEMPPSTDTDSPLRYLLENRVPIQWVPLVPEMIDPANGVAELQRGVVAVPTVAGTAGLAFAQGKILNPASIASNQPYRLPNEEVPRAGLRVERFVSRSRWVDGSSHLWVQRRRVTGTGETQSGLGFDLSLPVER